MPLDPPYPPGAILVMGAILAAASLVALAPLLTGCASPLARAENVFRAGDYPGAKESLAALESRAARWPPERAAEFALYRGLTFSALGDRERAERWLGQAATLERARPGTLSAEDAHRLQTAIEASGP